MAAAPNVSCKECNGRACHHATHARGGNFATRNIQADADLRLRGTPDRPILLGHVTVNSGQIEFFGNKYSINRGEVTFNNPAKIEPVINMDLSTTVRGITVDISFSGLLNKLNFSYRSDPPLEASDIVALLAVGRTPSVTGPLATSQATTNINNSYLGMGTGSNSLLSQAIAPNSNRLQKFFGVSHIKIDPQLTDVTIVPQARLTMEQQVSSDVTLTYITNLAVTNQQIVRVQWDFSRKWSAVALRDENGAFSIDFQDTGSASNNSRHATPQSPGKAQSGAQHPGRRAESSGVSARPEPGDRSVHHSGRNTSGAGCQRRD